MKLVNRQHMSGKLLLPCGIDHFVERHISAPRSMVSIIRQRFRVNRATPFYNTFSRAQRWLRDTFRGISGKYLQYYLDEFCYRREYFASRLPSICLEDYVGNSGFSELRG